MLEILKTYTTVELKRIISRYNKTLETIKGYSKLKKDALLTLMTKTENINKFKSVKAKVKTTPTPAPATPVKPTPAPRPAKATPIPAPRPVKPTPIPAPRPVKPTPAPAPAKAKATPTLSTNDKLKEIFKEKRKEYKIVKDIGIRDERDTDNFYEIPDKKTINTFFKILKEFQDKYSKLFKFDFDNRERIKALLGSVGQQKRTRIEIAPYFTGLKGSKGVGGYIYIMFNTDGLTVDMLIDNYKKDWIKAFFNYDEVANVVLWAKNHFKNIIKFDIPKPTTEQLKNAIKKGKNKKDYKDILKKIKI